MRSHIIACAALGAVLFSSSASAASFRVKGSLERAAWFETDGGNATDVRVLHGSGAPRVGLWVPGARQKVTVIAPGFWHPIYCGHMYTDSNGRFEGWFECGANLPGSVHIQYETQSTEGFIVGVFNEDEFWFRATLYGLGSILSGGIAGLVGFGGTGAVDLSTLPPEVFAWLRPARPLQLVGTNSYLVDFGNTKIGGGPGNSASLATWSAVTFDMVDFAYRQMKHSGGSPPGTAWVVNNPLWGAPTTLWTTIHMNQGRGWENNIGAISHELGHAMYNVRHSSPAVYWTQVVHYARNHSQCAAQDPAFAHYEGFAETVRDLVFRQHALQEGEPGRHQIAANCGGLRGLAIEGNATDVYSSIMHPPDSARSGSKNSWATMQLGSDIVDVPPLRDLFDAIPAAGTGLVSTRSWWDSYWASYCAVPHNGRQKFCGSERFRCWVRANAALSGEMPSSFHQEDCRPGAPVITGAVVTNAALSPAVVSVSFDAEHHTDGFELLASPAPAGFGTPGIDGSESRFEGVRLPFCDTVTLRVRARNDHGSVSSPGFVFTPMNERDCVPEEVALAEVTSLGGGLFRIEHDPAPQADEYRIQYGTDPLLASYAESSWTTATTHEVPLSIAPNRRGAYFRVLARGPFGVSVGPVLDQLGVPFQP